MEKSNFRKVINLLDNVIESKYVLGLIFAGAAIVYGILCFGQNIWLDEVITISFARMNSPEIIQATAVDVHPPLYYLIVRAAVLVFGDYIYVQKLISFVPFLLMLLVVITKVRRLFGQRTAFLTSALLCVTPCIIQKNVELRMYQWAMFFVFAFAVFLYSAVISVEETDKKVWPDWIATLIFGVAAAYTHYYALLTVAIFYLSVFFCWIKEKKVRNRILLLIAGSSILYLPWLIILINQLDIINETGWWNEASITLSYVMSYIFYPFEENTGTEKYVFAVILFICLIGNWFTKEKIHKKMAYCCMGAYLGLITVGMLVTFFYKPVFITRFMYPTVGILVLGLCIVLSKSRTLLIYFLCGYVLLLGAKTYNSELHYMYDAESVPKFVSFLEEHQGEDAVYIFDNGALDWFFGYFAPDVSAVSGEYALQNEISTEIIYYCTVESDKPDQVLMNELGMTSYEKLEHVNLRFHDFDIYELK